MNDCQCKECRERRESVARIKALKATWPEPEWDWEYLEAQCRDYRERVRRQVKRNGKWVLPEKGLA